MQSLRNHVQSLCSPDSVSRTLPGVVLLCNDVAGQRVFQQSAGMSSLDPVKARPLTEDSVFWIASCTKLLTSICALQIVERELFHLDDAVGEILPEIDTPQLLQRFDNNGTPQLRRATKPITLRHLLTHTSGMAYDFLNPDIAKWWTSTGKDLKHFAGDIVNYYSGPLVAEPGTQWNYSPGLDWAGLLIARLTGEPGLGEYARKNIFEPLGIKNIAFQKAKLPLNELELNERWAWTTVRKQRDRSIVAGEPIRIFDSKDEFVYR